MKIYEFIEKLANNIERVGNKEIKVRAIVSFIIGAMLALLLADILELL